jgi:t-SNARE complex subunit (syntaxin)
MTQNEAPYQQLREPLLANDADAEIIRQRNEDMAKLAKELGDLKDVVKEINVMIGEQGQDIKKIEQTSSQARQSVETGVKEQKKASEYACAARWKTLIIIIIAAILLAGVVLFIVWVSGGFRSNSSPPPSPPHPPPPVNSSALVYKLFQ